MIIHASCFTLRPWRRGDEAALVKHADNRRIWRNLRSNFPHPYTREDAENWIAECLESKGRALRLAIVVGNEPVGAVGVEFGGGNGRSGGEIGYWLGEELWGRGIATEAVGLAAAYAMDELGIERLEAAVLQSNTASIRVLEKNGFTAFARLRKGAGRPGKSAIEIHYVKER